MTDEQLLAGDGLGELFDRYREPLTKYVSDQRIQDADDLVQAVFNHVAENRHRLIEGRSFKPWLYTVASRFIKRERAAISR